LDLYEDMLFQWCDKYCNDGDVILMLKWQWWYSDVKHDDDDDVE